MGDLKACLKEAKNAIKDKDYEAVIIHCKDALKIDRKCYQALVMFGRACLEQKRFGDSKKSLMMGTTVDPDNPIAWQGLSSLHERNQSCFEEEEEIAIFKHLTEITNEEEKLDRLYRRFASVYQKHNNVTEAVLVLESSLKVLQDKKRIREVHKSVVGLLESMKEIPQELLDKLIWNYEQLIDESEIGENETNYQNLLKRLYKSGDYEKVMKTALNMRKIFPTVYPLEWIARVFVERNNYSISNIDESLISEEELLLYLERLLHLHAESPWGNLARAIIYAKNGSMADSKRHLKKGCEILSKDICAWMSLLDLQKKSYDFVGIDSTCRKLDPLVTEGAKIPNRFEDANAVKQHVLLMRVEALFAMSHEHQVKEAIILLNNVNNKSLDLRIMSIKGQIQLGMLEEGYQELEILKQEFADNLSVKKLAAFIASSKGEHEVAREILEGVLKEDAENAEVLLDLGKIHFNIKDFKKSLIYLLKSAKHNPNLSDAFLYIGHYYRLEDNLDKARKCYEKALSQNPGSEEAGSSLSDVYRITGQDEQNLELLLRVTSSGSTGWAWLHLGLHYLSVCNYTESIKALQRAVEISPTSRVCYECLGDAYLARGSHTAALKVFTKVTEMHPQDSLYSRCQIARINHLVGKYLESISQYEEVLSESLPDAVRTVAHVGLAEVLLTRAKIYKQDQLISNLKDDSLYAIRCLTRVACENANNMTVWKLLGDALTMQAIMPSSLSTFNVPARLLNASVTDVGEMVQISKAEVLLLGGRCYGVGLQVDNLNASLWHDLGVNIFLQGFSNIKLNKISKTSPNKVSKEPEELTDFVTRATSAIKKSLSLDSSNFNAWNSLGVISYFNEDFSLAQHCFIRSLQLHPTVDAWTHLGAMYLAKEDIQLAHEAFSEAQALDPGYVSCWVGQAMVATSVGHYEAYDLFRHTTLLSIHPESCIGFASNVLRKACDVSSDVINPAKDVDLHIPNVADSLTYYTREREEDVVAQNMLGLTLEMLGLHQSASDAFSKAVQLAIKDETMDDTIRDGIIANHSRVLVSLNKLYDAVNAYGMMKEPDFYSQCGLALTHLKASNFDEAYQKYKEACEWYAPDDGHKSHVMVALAFLQYKFRNIEEVKTLLFLSPSIQGLLALASLGLLQKDPTLTDAAVVELEPYADSKEYAFDVAFLKSRQAVMQTNINEAKLILSRAIHRHPNQSSLWRALSRQLLSCPSDSTFINKLVEGANAAAAAARVLAQAEGDNKNVVQDVVLRSLVHLRALSIPQPSPEKDKSKRKKKGSSNPIKEPILSKDKRVYLGLKEAQRAVLMCPSKPETWAVLIASLNSRTEAQELAKKWTQHSKPPLKNWLQAVCC